jgi:hypothetical protein
VLALVLEQEQGLGQELEQEQGLALALEQGLEQEQVP